MCFWECDDLKKYDSLSYQGPTSTLYSNRTRIFLSYSNPTRKFLKNDRVASSVYYSHFGKIAARPASEYYSFMDTALVEILSFILSLISATSITQIYKCFHDVFDYHNNNGDDKDYNGGDDYCKIFIANHRFRYSLLYSVLGFFATTLLEPYSESKKATRRCLLKRHLKHMKNAPLLCFNNSPHQVERQLFKNIQQLWKYTRKIHLCVAWKIVHVRWRDTFSKTFNNFWKESLYPNLEWNLK